MQVALTFERKMMPAFGEMRGKRQKKHLDVELVETLIYQLQVKGNYVKYNRKWFQPQSPLISW